MVPQRLALAKPGDPVGESLPAYRVLAATDPDALQELLAAVTDQRVVIWVDRLEELQVDPDGIERLAQYGIAIKRAASEGKELFALYGGYFAVALRAAGLSGCSHGIGFGEHRAYIELPNSGPPPARYYLPVVHRYVSQDLAEYLATEAPSLVSCNCPECWGRTPGELDYHSLMKHSVHVRAREIRDSAGKSLEQLAVELEASSDLVGRTLSGVRFPRNLDRQVQVFASHLGPWADALRQVLAH